MRSCISEHYLQEDWLMSQKPPYSLPVQRSSNYSRGYIMSVRGDRRAALSILVELNNGDQLGKTGVGPKAWGGAVPRMLLCVTDKGIIWIGKPSNSKFHSARPPHIGAGTYVLCEADIGDGVMIRSSDVLCDVLGSAGSSAHGLTKRRYVRCDVRRRSTATRIVLWLIYCPRRREYIL